MALLPKVGAGKTVVMDNYFNNEWRKNGYGVNVRHYTWMIWRRFQPVWKYMGVLWRCIGWTGCTNYLQFKERFCLCDG